MSAKTKPKVTLRKPPPPTTPATLEAFVRPPSSTGKTTTYTRRTGEKNGEELRRVTVYVPTELFKRASHLAVERDVSFSDLVAEALEALVK